MTRSLVTGCAQSFARLEHVQADDLERPTAFLRGAALVGGADR
jgi:hypothetical protein